MHALARFRDGAALAHLGYPDMRVPISFALTYPERRAVPVPQLDLASGSPSSSPRPISSATRSSGSPARRESAAARIPCAFNAANEVAVDAFLEGRAEVHGTSRHRRGALDGVDGAPARDARGARRRRRGGTAARVEKAGSSVSIFIAILGLGFLILIHEAGHFFASLAVGLRPRRFYVGFPPAIVKRKRNNIEYGVGAIPLGGFVTHPRHAPPDPARR